MSPDAFTAGFFVLAVVVRGATVEEVLPDLFGDALVALLVFERPGRVELTKTGCDGLTCAPALDVAGANPLGDRVVAPEDT
jgi:hypothetical protein